MNQNKVSITYTDCFPKMKRCFKCKQKKLLSEFFISSYTKDGYGNRCKECWKVYRAENRERLLVYSKQYYLENRDYYAKAWEKFYRANRKELLKRNHQYFASLRGKAACKRGRHKRRALLAACKINDLSTPQIEVLLQEAPTNCPVCSKPFNNNGRKKTIDHVFPLSKGGNNTLSNVQVICLSCNSKKSNKRLLPHLESLQTYAFPAL